MSRGFYPFAFAGIVLLSAGCGKGEATATGAKAGMTEPSASAAPSMPADAPARPSVAEVKAAPGFDSACKHATCADNFYVDTTAPDCAAGSSCSVTLKLVATGEFHVNDEYPYRFKADEAPGIEFGGTDAMGKGVFSKPAGDWRKTDAKTGAMTVKFTPADKGTKTISGTFKMSVCSAQNCLLEQRKLTVPVLAH